jgi:protocatechuate 3,4-dioxygenase beta subunit
MAIDFPTPTQIGETYTDGNGRTWTWTIVPSWKPINTQEGKYNNNGI